MENVCVLFPISASMDGRVCFVLSKILTNISDTLVSATESKSGSAFAKAAARRSSWLDMAPLLLNLDLVRARDNKPPSAFVKAAIRLSGSLS